MKIYYMFNQEDLVGVSINELERFHIFVINERKKKTLGI